MYPCRIYVQNTLKIWFDETTALDVERAIFNYVIQKCAVNDVVCAWENNTFKEFYKHKALCILNNIDKNGYTENDYILEAYQHSKIRPHDIVFMHYTDRHPEQWKEHQEAKKRQDEYKHRNMDETASDQFTCPRCNKRKTTYFELQTRSADEPMTTFVTCLVCKHRFRR